MKSKVWSTGSESPQDLPGPVKALKKARKRHLKGFPKGPFKAKFGALPTYDPLPPPRTPEASLSKACKTRLKDLSRGV